MIGEFYKLLAYLCLLSQEVEQLLPFKKHIRSKCNRKESNASRNAKQDYPPFISRKGKTDQHDKRNNVKQMNARRELRSLVIPVLELELSSKVLVQILGLPHGDVLFAAFIDPLAKEFSV